MGRKREREREEKDEEKNIYYVLWERVSLKVLDYVYILKSGSQNYAIDYRIVIIQYYNKTLYQNSYKSTKKYSNNVNNIKMQIKESEF